MPMKRTSSGRASSTRRKRASGRKRTTTRRRVARKTSASRKRRTTARKTSVRRKRRTFLHYDRLYTLWQGIAAMPPGARAVVEVGSHRGGSARFIGDALRALGRELPFYVCDTFKGHVVVDPAVDGRHGVGKQFAGIDDLDVGGIDLWLGDVHVVTRGGRHPKYREEDGQRVMKPAEIEVRIGLGRGAASETVWTCDFSHEYVTINADYRS